MRTKKKKDGECMNKFTYDIVYVNDLKVYRVFANIEERFFSRCIFSSPSRKECVEWLKTHKKGGKRK